MPTAVKEKPQSGTKLKPLGARVVIKPLQRDEMTKSGIVLPDTAKEKPQEGTVIATGPGGLDKNGNKVEMTLKVGDRVLYQKYAGTEFKIDDEEHLVMHQDDVLALVEK
ncbi:MAG: co-chaperone GroES [Chloroflexi bacterium]|nr:co-chaperone GroES [Chloroflexota bacterium]